MIATRIEFGVRGTSDLHEMENQAGLVEVPDGEFELIVPVVDDLIVDRFERLTIDTDHHHHGAVAVQEHVVGKIVLPLGRIRGEGVRRPSACAPDIFGFVGD